MSESRLSTALSSSWPVWSCAMLAATIPFAKKLVPGLIVLVCMYAIVHALRKREASRPKLVTPLILLLLMWLLLLTGMLHSEHTDRAIEETGIKLSFLVFPLLAFFVPLKRSDLRTIESAFSIGALAFIPVALAYGLYRSFSSGDLSFLTYQELGIYFHPTYAATYQAFAYFILLHHACNGHFLFKNKTVHLWLSLLTMVFIGMLASKAGFIAALISIVLGLIVYSKGRRTMVFKQSLLAMTVLFASILLAPGSSQRVEDAVTDIQGEVMTPSAIPASSGAHSSTELRMVNWKASWEILLSHPFGVGSGDAESELLQRYRSMGENYAAEKKLNAHNQFLQSGVEHGWPGLTVLTVLLLWLLRHALKTKNWLMLNFVLLCGMNFLFESFLEVQAGIVFFCFWIMVFARTSTDERQVTMS